MSSATLTHPLARVFLRVKDYLALGKIRLTSFVVFSGMMGYLIAAGPKWTGLDLLALSFGGLLITLSANAANQLLESDFDKQMKRTADRPLPAGRMSEEEALGFAVLTGLAGLLIFLFYTTAAAAFFGAVSWISYVFAYTPLKRVGTVAVWVGAIPGALPPLIGVCAFTGKINELALILFVLQFFWQLPHFGAIGRLGAADYEKAGFKLQGDVSSKLQPIRLAFETAALLAVCYWAYSSGYINFMGFNLSVALSGAYLAVAILLIFKNTLKSAKILMFASFFYLPPALLIFYFCGTR